jgi:hypothetical protein
MVTPCLGAEQKKGKAAVIGKREPRRFLPQRACVCALALCTGDEEAKCKKQLPQWLGHGMLCRFTKLISRPTPLKSALFRLCCADHLFAPVPKSTGGAAVEEAREKDALQRAYYGMLLAVVQNDLVACLLAAPPGTLEAALPAVLLGASTHIDAAMRKTCVQVLRKLVSETPPGSSPLAQSLYADFPRQLVSGIVQVCVGGGGALRIGVFAHLAPSAPSDIPRHLSKLHCFGAWSLRNVLQRGPKEESCLVARRESVCLPGRARPPFARSRPVPKNH